MKKLCVYLYVLGFVVVLTSCGSGGGTLSFASMGENYSVQRAIAGKWKLTKRVVEKTNKVISDCEHDNTLEIQGDGAYIFDNGVTQCNTDETNEVGTWTLSYNDKELRFTGNEDTKMVVLKSINRSKFVAEVNVKVNGKTQVEIHTYTKIQ